jgi:exopolysaccharide biosynthesis WecB/TagA/CpsF family protein
MRARRYVVTPNLDHCRMLRHDPLLRRAYANAGLVLPDGWPLLLASRFSTRPLSQRVTGADLIIPLCEAAAARGYSVYFLGGSASMHQKLQARLKADIPALRIAGWDAPTQNFEQNVTACRDVIAQIVAAKPDLLFVALGAPKQECWMAEHVATLPIGAAIGVGAGLDFIAGTVQRAPILWRHHHFEWAWRWLQEPRRLSKRYIACLAAFPFLFLRHVTQHIRSQSKPIVAWQKFLEELLQQGNESVLTCRHEVYFLRRKRWGGRVHALAAAARDSWLLLTLPALKTLHRSPNTLAVATLEGASGYGAIARAVERLASPNRCITVAHPRLQRRAQTQLPAPLFMADFKPALRIALPVILQPRGPLSRWVMASCVFRHHLWQASWRRFYAAHPQLNRCLLHNDFEMMNSALVSALSESLEIQCVQHGIPTDEFFPCRAATQIVWGESSQRIYKDYSPRANVMIDALGRDQSPRLHDATMPEEIHLLSQTHTPLYGIDLGSHFEELSEALAAQLPAIPLRILLHPRECSRHVYRALSPRLLADPPHRTLQQSTPRVLVIGYCSTALLDAAQAGQYVAAMDWPATASLGAKAVATPPTLCADHQAVLRLFHSLRESKEIRLAMIEKQQQWLARTFGNREVTQCQIA